MNKEINKDSSKHPIPDLIVPKPETDPHEIEEIGGVKGPEPTRYGDWEKNGRCVDF